MIPQAFIQDLLARVDIADVVGRVVKLKKAGANLQGLCPFHNEKSPSFTVSPTKQFYHCFGCGAHGSAIGFLMEQAGLSYVEAIEELAQGMGLTVPREASNRPVGAGPGSDRADRAGADGGDQRQRVLEALAAAARYYKQRLRDTPRAVDYLKARGVSGETAARFQLGYAPQGWRSLESAFADYGEARLVEAGLVIQSDDGKRYDRFRDRVMFPIRNPRGQVIGFGGRVLDQGEPKYLNSPETPVFTKGRELYGLHEARDAMRERSEVLVVEGYMDVVMLHQLGVPQAVAALGTATTEEHLVKLLRQVDRVIFAFDGDAAGQRAASRALRTALPRLADTKRFDFLFLPPEHDPDSFIRAEGLAAFEQLMATAVPLSQFLLRELARDLDTPEGRASVQAEFKPMVALMPDIALRRQIINEVASRARIDPDELSRYLGIAPARPAPGGEWRGRTAAARPAASNPDRPPFRPGSEGRFDGGRGPWRDGGGRRPGFGAGPGSSPAFPARRAALPGSLESSLHVLLAMHPGLARLPIDARFLPDSLLRWRERVAALPEGATFAVLLESLRADAPDEAERLAAAQSRGARLRGELGFEQAESEYTEALQRLRRQGVRAEIEALAAGGLETEGDRTRYTELMGVERKLSGVPD